MPVTRAIERNSIHLSNSPPKSYGLSSHLSTQYEESNGHFPNAPERLTNRRPSDAPRKSNTSAKNSSALSAPHPLRRSVTNDGPVTRGRSNTDVQSVMLPMNNLKQQSSNGSGSGSEKSLAHNNQSRTQSPPPKPRCTLPLSNGHPGYVTPSKLFNMMGYGLENQYLFMHAHYLYIIDCRSIEQFNDGHIVTGKLLSHCLLCTIQSTQNISQNFSHI